MKQRKYSAEEKLSVIMEMLKGQKPISQICREHGIRDSLAYKWRDEGLESLRAGLSDKRKLRHHTPDAERERLLKIIGQQTVIIDFQKKMAEELGV